MAHTTITRGLLLAGIALFPTGLLAQTAATPAVTEAAADEADIVVTGSRIKRPDFEAPNPIVSFDAAKIVESGNTNLTNFLQRVPGLQASRDSAATSGGQGTLNTFGQTGLNQLNLRNLGANRTLVLVNGRRHVAGEPNSAAVDINAIPTDLVERVDVLTGAVSAIYGADGVTGVVNFILKRDFEGVTGRAQFGISTYGDAGNRFGSLAAGKNFGDGRGNVTLAYEYNADDPVGNDDRDYLTKGQRKFLIPNDADFADDPNVPDNILVGDLRYTNESPIGAVYIGAYNAVTNPDAKFDGLGRPYDNGSPAAYYRTGGVSTDVAGFYQGDLFPKTERHAINLLGHYDFSDAFKLSVEAKYVAGRARSLGQLTGTYFQPVSIDNPFVPSTIRNAAIAQGENTVYVNRDNLDYGRPGEEDFRQTYRGVIDASGKISDHATWDASYEYGRTDVRITKIGDRLTKQYTDALDAVTDPVSGNIVCNPTNNPGAGCVPISLFGPGPATAQQLAYFRRNHSSTARITQNVASASISGDFGQFFELPGGPVKFAFGGEYRKESSRFDPNADLINARFFQFDEPALVAPSRGSFDVKEAFGELELPILKDRPFAHILSIGAAGRFSHYSTIGDTKTWQFNGTYAPIADIAFRGSYGRAVRAPNIGELFQPTQGTAKFFTDPCTPDQINNGTKFRAANCATTLAAVGAIVSPGLQTSQNINGTSSGNLNLRPEVAKTWTAGVLLRPRFIPGFNASIDWYDINLKDAINTVAAGDLANLCVDQATVPNQYCNQFTRAQGTGIINGFTLGPLNVANFHTAGLDINLDYVLRTQSEGVFDFRLVVGYLHKLEVVGIPGAPVVNLVDQSQTPQFATNFSPRWTVNFTPTWTYEGLTISYTLRAHNRTLAYDRVTLAAQPDIAAPEYLKNSALWQHDAQIKYRLDKGFEFYFGINNITNQKPDPASFFTNIPISPLGRYFYTGVRVDFGR